MKAKYIILEISEKDKEYTELMPIVFPEMFVHRNIYMLTKSSLLHDRSFGNKRVDIYSAGFFVLKTNRHNELSGVEAYGGSESLDIGCKEGDEQHIKEMLKGLIPRRHLSKEEFIALDSYFRGFRRHDYSLSLLS